MKEENKFQTIIIDNIDDGGDEVNIIELIEKYSYHWRWFVISLILTISSTIFYLYVTQDQYSVSAIIFVEDEDSGGMTSERSSMEDLGMVSDGEKKSIINETGVLRSRTLMQNVVKDLKLNISYFKREIFFSTEIYKDVTPIKLIFRNDTVSYGLDTLIRVIPTSKSHFTLKSEDKTVNKKCEFGNEVKTEFGKVIIIDSNLSKSHFGQEYLVKINSLAGVVSSYRQRLKIEPETKKSSLLVLSLTDKSKNKAQDILNNLVYQYNKDAVDYKTLITKNTDKFINQRISDLSIDLEGVDRVVEDFKTKNKLTDIDFEASLDLTSNSELEKKIVDLTSQIQLVNYIQNHMDMNKDDLIPANMGLNDNTTTGNTAAYNKLLLEKNRIIKNSSELNPTVINLDAQIATLRQSIEQSLINLKSSLTFSLKEAKNQEYRLNARRQNAPKQEREFQDIKRKQLIVETLYLYLLEKREENAIKMGIPVPNAKIIDRADGSDTPVAPKRTLILIVSIIIGLVIPAIIISIRDLFDYKIHTREDVEGLVKAPIIGDIPRNNSKEKLIIGSQDKGQIAEAFRVLRTNVNFMLTKIDNESKTIFVTSTIGSEGKTFISINLASSLALLGKKVLLIGADIRKPKINEYLKTTSRIGLTNYLVDSNLELADIICKNEDSDFDLLVSGDIPPNPSELLLNGRFKNVINYGKENYDYVIIDTAPVNMVTDTLLLGEEADLFIYVVRSNFLDKRLLKVPKLLYEQKRLPNMTILLNDLNIDKHGYGYGYGYGYSGKDHKPWYKRILSRWYPGEV